MNILSLFSGIEGFVKGFEMASFKFNKHYTSEIDKYASAITRYNYPNAIELGSVTGVSGLKDIDIITFGFPCQDLSIAGNRAGFKGSRSSLFFEAMRIIQETRPRLFIFENVKGLFSSNGGRDFITVLRTIADIGLYECEWQLVNTRWVLPQNRERVYFIGHLKGNGFRKVFPIRESVRNCNDPQEESERQRQRVWDENCASSLIKSNSGTVTLVQESHSQLYCIGSKQKNATVLENCSTSLTSAMGEGGGHTPMIVHNTIPRSSKSGKKGADAIEIIYKHKTGKVKQGYSQTGSVFGVNGQAPTLDIANSRNYDINSRIRRLTPIECERLQGFPDNWTKYGMFDNEVKEISDSQRYKTLGNAVTTNIVKMIAERL